MNDEKSMVRSLTDFLRDYKKKHAEGVEPKLRKRRSAKLQNTHSSPSSAPPTPKSTGAPVASRVQAKKRLEALAAEDDLRNCSEED